MAIANVTTAWVNPDGLRVKFPADEVTLGKGGDVEDMLGQGRQTMFDIDYTQVAQGLTSTNVFILDYDTVFSDTCVIDKWEFITGTAWATDTTINFGFVKHSDFTTIISATGLASAFILAARDTAGETTNVTPGGTYAGSLMGVQAGIGFDAVLCTHFTGSAPTAGTGKLRITWRDSAAS